MAWLADLGADGRFAWRILAKDRWFTAGAILTLALAMGVANTTFISTYAVLWRDFPFERPDRIAIMRTVDARGREAGLSFADYQDWRRDARVFDGPAAGFAIATISLGRDGAAPEQFEGLYVSAATFSVLRVKPQLGRDFSAADDRPGAEAVAIISSNLWKGRYAASRDVLGRKVSINGATPATIIGVMPDGIRFIDFTDVWLPLAQMPGVAAQRRDSRTLMMIGRLPDGADLDRVRAELTPIAANLAVAHPDTNKDVRPLVNTLLEAYNGGGSIALTNSMIYMPLLAAAFVLLIAAANLANLLLARAAYRSREIAIRAGDRRHAVADRAATVDREPAAGVRRVGSGPRILMAHPENWTSQVDPLLPYWRLKMDVRLLGFLAAVALLHHRALRPGAGTLCLASRDRRWAERRRTPERNPEGAPLDPRAARRAVRLDAGPAERRRSDSEDLLQDLCALTSMCRRRMRSRRSFDSRHRNMRRRNSASHSTQQLRDRLLAVPGVTASTIASAPPFTSAGRRRLTAVDGRPASDPPPDVMTVIVEPAYFHTVVRGLVLGESFSELHGTPGNEAAIVNQRFAEVYLGAGNPIGRRLELRPPTAQRTYLREADGPAPPVRVTIVGVSPDIRQSQQDAVPMVYLPFRAEAPAGVTLIVRGSGGPARVVSAARDAVNAIDPDLALGVVRTLDELRDRSRSPSAGSASQFAKIGGLALVFSGVGLYSAMAYAVRRRTQEIAVRMALGAQANARALAVPQDRRPGSWLPVLVLGVPASLWVGRLLQNNVVRVESRDLAMLIAMVVILAIVALVASIIPARRATRLEPTVALRIE